METPRIERKSGGLKCDSPTCDWTDPTVKVEDYKEWLNAPCPKCGDNVLTQEDFDNVMKVIEMVDLINTLSEEALNKFMESKKSITDAETSKKEFYEKHNIPEGTEKLNLTLNVHKGIHIKEIKPADDGKE